MAPWSESKAAACAPPKWVQTRDRAAGVAGQRAHPHMEAARATGGIRSA
jgi:hypothetical protein